jgi:hypothetical protein
VAASFMGVLAQIPVLHEKIRSGRQAERFYGAADLPNFFRKPYGPGWALVGDAGYHKDPYMALGICDALRDAELLASAIEEGLSGRRALVDALAGYEERRNAEAINLYRQNAQLAQFNPVTGDELAMRATLRGDQEETNRYYLALEGIIPREEFFNVVECATGLDIPSIPKITNMEEKLREEDMGIDVRLVQAPRGRSRIPIGGMDHVRLRPRAR